MTYRVITGPAEVEYQVRKSRFISRVESVQSRDAAVAAVARMRERFPDARHHCWAYLLGRPEDASGAGMNDDGEPAGTAGRPILNVLQHGPVGDAVIVIARYFGGVKLGAGGLVRAYSAAARQVLDAVSSRVAIPTSDWSVQGDFSAEQAVRHFLAAADGELLAVHYGTGVELALRVPLGAETTLQALCAAQGYALRHIDSAGS